MGQEIVYCFKCLTRLTGSEFEKGKAFRFGLRVTCKDCLPELLATLTPDERKRFHEPPPPPPPPRESQGISSTRIRVPTARRRADEEGAARPKGKGLVWGLVVGATVLVGVGVILLRPSGSPQTEPVVKPPPVADPPKPPSEDARVRRAREAIDRAKKTAVADLDAKLALWAEAVKVAQGTELYAEAVEAEQALLAQRKTSGDKEAAAIQEEAAALMAGGEHAKAADVYEKAKARRPGPDWAAAMTAKADEVKRLADTAYAAFKTQALAAARKGNAAEVKKAEDSVLRMGYSDHAADLRKELAAVKVEEKPKPPPTAPPTAELLAYRQAWLKPVALAVERDFEGAVAEHARLAKDLKEKDATTESTRDGEDFARLRDLAVEIRRGAFVIGKDVSVEILDDDGKRKKVLGKVLRVEAERAELSGEPTVFVELSDLTAVAMAEALGRIRKPAGLEQRAFALLAAAEGDVAGATKLFSAIPGRYKDLAKDAASRVPKRSEREREARKLFYDAEREYRDSATRGEAVSKYRKLIADFADARIVKADADVRRRAEEGREYFLPPGLLKSAGTFKAAKGEKPESFWSSIEDTDPEKATENFVEFEFLAVADTPYKAWVYAGGCCGEVFTFSWQATDLAGPNPKKPSETVQAAPEGPNHLPVRHGVLYLKPKHADHLGPKSPKRWAWVSLPLPKYPAAGVKRVRLLTNQKGFSIAYAVVSSTRTSPPGEAEVKEIQGRTKSADLGLIAWWKLDEASGPTAADAVGNFPAQSRGAVEWGVRGKLGGAVRLATNGWLEVSNDPALNAFPLTACAWLQTTSATNGGVVNKYLSASLNGYQLVLMKGSIRGWYFRSGKENCVWDGQEGLNGGAVNDGAWHHVALVVDGEGGRIYVDGVRKDSRAWTGTAGATTTTQPLGLGRYPGPNPTAFFNGLLDDVRIYGRALSDAELAALHAAGPPAESAAAPAEEARPWKPIFDGKTTSCLGGGSERSWKVDNGMLVKPSGDDAAQSREEYGDGEFRFRFDATGIETVRFSVRQGADGAYSVGVDDNALATAKTHELIIVCNGESVTASFNGKPVTVDAHGRSLRGKLQFNNRLGSMRVHSIDMRPLP